MSERPKIARTRRVERWMRRRGWSYETPPNGLRRRLWSLASDHHRWWDWGHRVMILVGSDMCGNWDSPGPPTWYYRRGPAKRMWRTGYPRHPLSSFEIVTDYETFSARTDGLDEDEMYEWRALCFDQDDQLQLGHRYWGKDFYGLPHDEVALLRRYLRMAHRHDWWGLRSWLYSQALNAAVNEKKPFACNAAVPPGHGGYTHWHCKKKRNHVKRGDTMHRFNNYVWGEIDGEQIGTVFSEQAR